MTSQPLSIFTRMTFSRRCFGQACQFHYRGRLYGKYVSVCEGTLSLLSSAFSLPLCSKSLIHLCLWKSDTGWQFGLSHTH